MKSYALAGVASALKGEQCSVLPFLTSWYNFITLLKMSGLSANRYLLSFIFSKKANEAGVRNNPTLIQFKNVYIDGKEDFCEIDRVSAMLLADHIHQRYHFKKCGLPVREFHY